MVRVLELKQYFAFYCVLSVADAEHSNKVSPTFLGTITNCESQQHLLSTQRNANKKVPNRDGMVLIDVCQRVTAPAASHLA